MREQIRKLAVGGPPGKDDKGAIYQVSDSEDEELQEEMPRRVGAWSGALWSGGKWPDRTDCLHGALVTAECAESLGPCEVLASQRGSPKGPTYHHSMVHVCNGRRSAMPGWSKPQEVTDAICEALKRNFVFKGISESLLLEVRRQGIGHGNLSLPMCSCCSRGCKLVEEACTPHGVAVCVPAQFRVVCPSTSGAA